MSSSKSKLLKVAALPIAIAIFFFLAVIVVLADLGRMPAFLFKIYEMPYGDKIGHFFLMGLLGFGLNLAFSFRKINLLTVPLFSGTVTALILVTLEEISQNFFPSRSFSLVDLTFSCLGILVSDFILRRSHLST